MQPTISADPVSDFLTAIQRGVDSWHTAGEMLSKMRQKNPGIYGEIIRREPLMTVDMLETIERIGRNEVHPRLLLNAQLPVKRLMGFPYAEQNRLCSEPVDVVVKVSAGKPTIHKKLIRDLSRLELNRALDVARVRTVQEQVAMMKPHEGNDKWRALSQKPKPILDKSISSFKPATAPPPDIRNRLIGRWVVRKGIGNNCCFERTNAPGISPVRIILGDDSAVLIEVYQKPA